jgi:hypothetical protein
VTHHGVFYQLPQRCVKTKCVFLKKMCYMTHHTKVCCKNVCHTKVCFMAHQGVFGTHLGVFRDTPRCVLLIRCAILTHQGVF